MRLSDVRRRLAAVFRRLWRRLWRPRPPAYTPQLDVPLWRGTDLAPLPDVPLGDVEHPWPGGALLHLAHVTDETAARYWLAVYARRGATQDDLRDAWDEWQRQQQSNVTYLHTDPEDRP